MAITKLGANISSLDKEAANLADETSKATRWVLGRTKGSILGRQWSKIPGALYRKGVKFPYEKGLRPVAKGAFKGVQRGGELIYDHPKVALPAATLGLTGAYSYSDKRNKALAHIDPDKELTQTGPARVGVGPASVKIPYRHTKLRWRSPAAKEYFERQNNIF